MVETRARKKAREAREEREASAAPQPAALPQPAAPPPTALAPGPNIPTSQNPPVPAPTSVLANSSVTRKRKRLSLEPEIEPEGNGSELGQGKTGSEGQATAATNIEEEEAESTNKEAGKKRRVSKEDEWLSGFSPIYGGSEYELQQDEQELEEQMNQVLQTVDGEGGEGEGADGQSSNFNTVAQGKNINNASDRKRLVYIRCEHPNEVMRPFDLQSLLSSRLLPVQRAMLRCLGLPEISALSRTGGFGDMRDTLRRTDYNFDKRLAHFLNNPNEFRRILARSRGLVTGEVALDFFEPMGEVPRVCSVNISFSGSQDMGIFLEGEGYRSVAYNGGESDTESDDDEDVYADSFIASKYHRKYGKLEIWVTGFHSPIFNILQCTNDTHTLKFITHEKAYALFPHLGFQRKMICPLWPVQEHTSAPYMRKVCLQFGYKTITTSLDEKLEAEMAAPRRIGDNHTMVIPLDMDGLENIPGYSAASNVEHTTFRLRLNRIQDLPGADVLERYEMAIRRLGHGVMQHEYATMDWDDNAAKVVARYNDRIDTIPIQRYIKQVEGIAKKLRDYTVIELLKLPIEQRRPDGYQTAQEIHDMPIQVPEDDTFDIWDSEPPADWPTYDDEVCKTLDTAWDELQLSLERRKEKAVEEHGFPLFP